MKSDYKDITSRISDPIQWYDENGTPRYDKFHPHDLPNIYAHEGVLIEIACQACGKRFLIGLGSWGFMGIRSIADQLNDHAMAYGDPPIHWENCAAGNTMTSDFVRVVEYWFKNSGYDWEQMPELEITLNGWNKPREKD
jgi:hypothetical protein